MQVDKRYGTIVPEDQRSGLRGGSWTILFWHMEIIDWVDAPPKKYVLAATDNLMQPPVYIDFTGLLRLLLDLGAVPNIQGLQRLRIDREHIMAGSTLLEHKDGTPVLSAAARESDEDNELLSVRIRWSGLTKCKEEQTTNALKSFDMLQLRSNLAPSKAQRTTFIPNIRGGRSFYSATNPDIVEDDPKIPKAPNGRTVPIGVFRKYLQSERFIKMFEYDMVPEEEGWEPIIGKRLEVTDSDEWEDPLKHVQAKE
jgi:hypothetical protein